MYMNGRGLLACSHSSSTLNNGDQRDTKDDQFKQEQKNKSSTYDFSLFNSLVTVSPKDLTTIKEGSANERSRTQDHS